MTNSKILKSNNETYILSCGKMEKFEGHRILLADQIAFSYVVKAIFSRCVQIPEKSGLPECCSSAVII